MYWANSSVLIMGNFYDVYLLALYLHGFLSNMSIYFTGETVFCEQITTLISKTELLNRKLKDIRVDRAAGLTCSMTRY